MKVSSVLFDLDGTLTDSARGIVSSYRHALNEFGLDAEETVIRRWIGPPLMDGFAALGVPADGIDAAIDSYRSHFAAVGLYVNELYPGVVEMLSALSSAGITLALATSKLGHFAHTIVHHFGIGQYFSAVAGSSPEGDRLYKVDIAAYALDCLGRPDPTTVALVGDRKDDVEAAVRLGLHPIGVTWGYGTRSELTGHGARYLVDAPLEVVELLGARATRNESLIYKILLPDEWETFDSSDRFDGSPLDAESGFVHCSSRSQIAATAKRFFFGEPSIVVVAVDTASIAETLRWEPAPNGDLFPHVYGPLPRDSVAAVYRVAGAAELDGAIEGGRAGTAGDGSR